MADGTEGINFKVTIHGGNKTNRKPSNFNPLTLKQLLKWIDDKPIITDAVKEELKKMASTFPQQALPKWQAAFPKYLAKARETLLKKDMFTNTQPIKEENAENQEEPRISEVSEDQES